jgi:hypothetical protein
MSEAQDAQATPEQDEYEMHQHPDPGRRHNFRMTALSMAVSRAQPGVHADAVLADAEKFLAWLTTDA